MKALFVKTPGEVPELEVREVETPKAGGGEVVVQVAAAGLCGHDVAVMTGLLRRGVRHDVIPGHEAAGRAVDVGEGVSGVSVGDAVAAALTAYCGDCDRCRDGQDYRCRDGLGLGHAINGAFAEYVRLPARCVSPVPEGVDVADAALVACPIGVCVRALREAARVSAGDSVLVTGAGGGLGIHAVQTARALGAETVFGVTTSPDKLDAVERFAPGGAILGGDFDFSELALAFTEDQGVSVVIDTVGSATFRSSVRSLSQRGRMVVIGEVVGGRASISLTDLMFRDATLRGSTGANGADVSTALGMLRRGEVSPVIHETLPLEDAGEAVRRVAAREAVGRIALSPA